MKAILEYNLPEDTQEFERTFRATDLCAVIWDMEQFFRNKLKHEDLTGQSADEAYDKAWDKLRDLKEENGIDLDQIFS